MPRLPVTRSARARQGGSLAPLALAALLALALLPAGPAPARAQDGAAPPPSAPPPSAPPEAQPAEPGAEPLPGGWRPRPVRSGTVSLGGGVTFGTLLGQGLGVEFTNGVGLGFSLRYRSGSDAAYGLSFEAHNFGTVDSSAIHDRLQLIETTVDYYFFGATRTRMPRYVMVGAGLAQTRITDFDGEKEFPGDGGVFTVGAGVEYWQWRSMTIDFSLRYHGLFMHQKLAHDLQAGLGLNFYTSP